MLSSDWICAVVKRDKEVLVEVLVELSAVRVWFTVGEYQRLYAGWVFGGTLFALDR